jgi:hypothetical protein
MNTINFSKLITIIPNEESVLGDTPTKINWAAIGSVTIEEAEKFCNDLQEAILQAKNL